MCLLWLNRASLLRSGITAVKMIVFLWRVVLDTFNSSPLDLIHYAAFIIYIVRNASCVSVNYLSEFASMEL